MTSAGKKLLISIVIILLLILILIVSFVFKTLNRVKPINYAQSIEEVNASTLAEVKSILTVKQNDTKIGNENAPIQIISYDSYSCVHCATFFTKIFPLIKQEYIDTGKVLFIHREFPLDKQALYATKLLKCFIKSKKPTDKDIFNVISGIFQSQRDWLVAEDDQTKLIQIFNLVGLDNSKSKECIQNEALENTILEERLQAGKLLKINATPTFFINGVMLNKNYSFQSFKEEIEAILNK